MAARPNVWDVAALILVIGAMVLIVYGGQQTVAPLSELERAPVSLDPANLPLYALRTTLRMLLAMVCSTVFTFVYAAIAAKSRRAELVMIPLLDILQSVPILGFLTFTVVFFMNLFPDQVLGAELASVFAIFTSQAWNMTFSMYQSIRNVPKDLEEATQSFHLSGWQRFWHLDVPFAMPGLIWNAMMSMSGGWFFVVASEAITVGTTTVTLPGIGSYVALAIQQQDLSAILYALLAMLLVIIAYDQLLFRPIVAWADKFRFEQTASGEAPASWMLDLFRRTRALRALTLPFAALNRAISNLRIPLPKLPPAAPGKDQTSRLVDTVWIALILAGTAYAAWLTYRYLSASLGMSDVLVVIRDGLITLLRVAILDQPRHADLGAGWRVDRASPEAGRTDPAAGPVSGGLPGQSRLPRLCRRHCQLQAQSRHLAEPADDPGHAVVHPVQRDRGRERLSDRSARSRRQLPSPGMAVVDQGHPARNLPVLRHRCNHGIRRLLECVDRRGGRKLGRHASEGHRARRLYCFRNGSRRLPARRARNCHDVHPGDVVQSTDLAAALRVRRAAPAPWLTRLE
ncbi:ABC-type nitrate/sulfonate/bicarbonate transport system permease component [Bradyrhizobium sp. i1.3.6]